MSKQISLFLYFISNAIDKIIENERKSSNFYIFAFINANIFSYIYIGTLSLSCYSNKNISFLSLNYYFNILSKYK